MLTELCVRSLAPSAVTVPASIPRCSYLHALRQVYPVRHRLFRPSIPDPANPHASHSRTLFATPSSTDHDFRVMISPPHFRRVRPPTCRLPSPLLSPSPRHHARISRARGFFSGLPAEFPGGLLSFVVHPCRISVLPSLASSSLPTRCAPVVSIGLLCPCSLAAARSQEEEEEKPGPLPSYIASRRICPSRLVVFLSPPPRCSLLTLALAPSLPCLPPPPHFHPLFLPLVVSPPRLLFHQSLFNQVHLQTPLLLRSSSSSRGRIDLAADRSAVFCSLLAFVSHLALPAT